MTTVTQEIIISLEKEEEIFFFIDNENEKMTSLGMVTYKNNTITSVKMFGMDEQLIENIVNTDDINGMIRNKKLVPYVKNNAYHLLKKHIDWDEKNRMTFIDIPIMNSVDGSGFMCIVNNSTKRIYAAQITHGESKKNTIDMSNANYIINKSTLYNCHYKNDILNTAGANDKVYYFKNGTTEHYFVDYGKDDACYFISNSLGIVDYIVYNGAARMMAINDLAKWKQIQ